MPQLLKNGITGCSVTKIDSSGVPISHSGCPVTGTMTVVDKGNESFREAPRPDLGQTKLLESHIHRANHARNNIEDPESRRVFRQGYEFFEGTSGLSSLKLCVINLCLFWLVVLLKAGYAQNQN